MELFDYIVFRWKTWLALLVVGLVAVLVAGLNAGAGGYRAQAELLVRPSASQSSTYASDPDRYIETEMALLYTEANLTAEAEDSGMSAENLADALTYTHEPGSESVTLTVDADTERRAVRAVNAVADSYVSTAAGTSGPDEEQAAALSRQITDTQEELGRVNTTIQQATDQFIANNPDEGAPSASTIAPAAAVRQSLLTNRLQQLSSLQTELEIEAATTGTRSQVLQSADGATAVQGWGPTALLAAAVGWVLVLLTLAAAGLALTSRLIGPARWTQATGGPSSFAGAHRLRKGSDAARRGTVRRVRASLAARGDHDGPVSVVYVPGRTARLKERSGFLLAALDGEGLRMHERESLAQVAADSEGSHGGPVERTLMLVDLEETRTDDARALSEHPERVRRHAVPVLV